MPVRLQYVRCDSQRQERTSQSNGNCTSHRLCIIALLQVCAPTYFSESDLWLSHVVSSEQLGLAVFSLICNISLIPLHTNLPTHNIYLTQNEFPTSISTTFPSNQSIAGSLSRASHKTLQSETPLLRQDYSERLPAYSSYVSSTPSSPQGSALTCIDRHHTPA
jgi:hypothetical protein